MSTILMSVIADPIPVVVTGQSVLAVVGLLVLVGIGKVWKALGGSDSDLADDVRKARRMKAAVEASERRDRWVKRLLVLAVIVVVLLWATNR